MDHTGVDDLQDFLAQLDAYGLRLFAVYLDVWADRDRQWFNEGLEQAIEQLKNRDVVLWVPIRSNDFKASEQNGDAAAVKVVREIADLAAAANLKVALYPHSFFLLQTIGDAIRISNKVDRPNVGVTFNLCHWLRTDKSDLEKTLESARSYLKVVTLNGADNEGDWKQLIQPLDVGQFDVFELLSNLKKINYSGPIGLQGYGIGGDVRKNLDRSMDAWVKLNGN